jgi:hypothetical protein
MSEKEMIDHVQEALDERGIDDQVVAVGQFNPRGASGGGFAGGWIGDDVGGAFGDLGDAVGTVGGYLAGRRAAGAASGLPNSMLVAVSDSTVYGFEAAHRKAQPSALVFRVPRSSLEVKVHQRVNVRVLELIEADGTRIELEGNRLPLTHSKDVIEHLR